MLCGKHRTNLAATKYFCLRPQLHSPRSHLQLDSGLTSTSSVMFLQSASAAPQTSFFSQVLNSRQLNLLRHILLHTLHYGSLEYSRSSFQKGIVFNLY